MTMEVVSEPWHKLGASRNVSEEINIREQAIYLSFSVHLLDFNFTIKRPKKCKQLLSYGKTNKYS